MKLRHLIAGLLFTVGACSSDGSDPCNSECVMCEVTDYGEKCVSP